MKPIILTKNEFDRFMRSVDNPPKANKELTEIIKRIKSMPMTTHKVQIVGCGCSGCRRGLRRNGRQRCKSIQQQIHKKIRRAWNQTGKIIARISRGYTD